MDEQKQDLQILDEVIMNQIYFVRGQKVMLDTDLATLYEVETKQLKRQVRRNSDRFPQDFMFELTIEEYNSLRCQIGTLEKGAHSKYLSMAFTEQGVSMLSSVLNSSRAIKVNIQIIRIFTRMRQMLMDNTEIRLEIEKIKGDLSSHGKNMEVVFQYLDELLKNPDNPSPRRTRIGFKPDTL